VKKDILSLPSPLRTIAKYLERGQDLWSLKTRNDHSSESLGTPCHDISVGDGYERWWRRMKGSEVVPQTSSNSDSEMHSG
jgi:hypothetical protein